MSISAPALASEARIPDTRIRPLMALRAVLRLLRDPEDTSQVFVAVKALRGKSGVRVFKRFAQTPEGAQVLAERRSLLAYLSDDAALATAPAGSLARAYRAFMAEEGLSAAGLADASVVPEIADLSPDALLFRDRMRDMHDLMHVLTGYGRDPLGELCVLAVTHAQTRNPGLLLIMLLGGLRIARATRRLDVFASILEAHRHGVRTQWLPAQDWEALLDRPLEALRRELRIAQPRRYAPLGG
ncbi:Coq4 family protein [Caulobacter sp. S45]|uniref:Coq4 family protein n=1 Tax=Caulobacter sp. S45 TaxID=1641861 RepID=UPI00131EBEFE|nr:Coq4 family protein [Caulobacter sp. S45]